VSTATTPTYIDHREVSFMVLPRQGDSSQVQYIATAAGVIGGSTTSNPTFDHATGPKPANYNRAGRVGTAAISSLAGDMPSPAIGAPVTAYDSRQRFQIIAGIRDAIAAGQFGMGLCQDVPAWTNAIEPDVHDNCFFLGARSDQATMRIIKNDGSGTADSATNLGASFPSNSADLHLYKLDLLLQSVGGVCSILWKATELISGATAQGTETTDIPVGNFVNLRPFWCRGSANTATIPSAAVVCIRAGSFCDFTTPF
jgi:hypothetical protein